MSSHVVSSDATALAPEVELLLSHIQNLDIRDVTAEGGNHAVSFRLPGLHADGFNRFGHPRAAALMDLASSVRYWLHQVPMSRNPDEYFLDWAKTIAGSFAFMKAVQVEFSRLLYLPSSAAAAAAAGPSLGSATGWLAGRAALASVGNTSLALLTSLWPAEASGHAAVGGGGPEPLVKQLTQTVMVSPTDRKSTPLPDWFKEKFKSKATMDKGLVLNAIEKPDDTFRYTIKVRSSDIDAYQHTHFTRYADFAQDAVAAAVAARAKGSAYTSRVTLTEAALRRGLRRLQLCYDLETGQGDELRAHVWQAPGGPGEDEVKVVMEKDGVRVCQAVLDYFSDGVRKVSCVDHAELCKKHSV